MGQSLCSEVILQENILFCHSKKENRRKKLFCLEEIEKNILKHLDVESNLKICSLSRFFLSIFNFCSSSNLALPVVFFLVTVFPGFFVGSFFFAVRGQYTGQALNMVSHLNLYKSTLFCQI